MYLCFSECTCTFPPDMGQVTIDMETKALVTLGILIFQKSTRYLVLNIACARPGISWRSATVSRQQTVRARQHPSLSACRRSELPSRNFDLPIVVTGRINSVLLPSC